MLEKLVLLICNPFTKNFIANICGHQTKTKGFIHYFGTEDIMRNEFEENGNPNYCFDCLAKMTIICPWCEQPITVGEPISLSVPCEPDYKIPEHTAKHDGSYVGCLGIKCSDGIFDRHGFWMPPGKVVRTPSLVEMLLAGGGKSVIIHDVRNPKDLGTYL